METSIAWLLRWVMPMILLCIGVAVTFAQPEFLFASNPLIRIASRVVMAGRESFRNAIQSATQEAGV